MDTLPQTRRDFHPTPRTLHIRSSRRTSTCRTHIHPLRFSSTVRRDLMNINTYISIQWILQPSMLGTAAGFPCVIRPVRYPPYRPNFRLLHFAFSDQAAIRVRQLRGKKNASSNFPCVQSILLPRLPTIPAPPAHHRYSQKNLRFHAQQVISGFPSHVIGR